MVIATFGLDWLGNNSSDMIVVFLYDAFRFCQAALLLSSVLLDMSFEWILEHWEWCSWPVECWNVDFVDRLAACRRKGTEKTTVEGVCEGHDRKLRRTGSVIQHAGLDF